MTLNFISDVFKLANSDHDKTVSPEKTIETFKKRCGAANLDILEETKRIDNNRLGIPVYFSICGHDAKKITGTKKQMGKGVTPMLAKASAVMELGERFSLYSFIQNTDNFKYTTYDNVKNHAVLFEQIAKSVHEKSCEDLEISRKIFSLLNLKWAKAYNITRDKNILIPLDWFFMINEFNGSSAGNCNEEAICQGASEVVERHVSAIIAEKKPELSYIDHNSITNPITIELIEKFKKSGIKLYINDFTLNTGIPTIGVLAFDPKTFPQTSEIVWTAGTSPCPDKALTRALTEVAQLAGDFNTASNYVASGLPKFTNLQQADFIINPFNNKNCKIVKLNDLPNLSKINIKNEIYGITRALNINNFDLITLNITNKKLLIPAFYTIIPGTNFRERAENSSIAMFASKHIFENNSPFKALKELKKISQLLPLKYYIEFYQGLCHISLENSDKALKHLESSLELNPAFQDLATIYSYAGVCLKNMGKYKKAISILKKGLNTDNERDDIYNLMGFCNFKLKKHEKSIKCFEKVLEIKPGSGIDYANIASNHRELGNIKKAIDYYEIALAMDSNITFARENLKKLKNM